MSRSCSQSSNSRAAEVQSAKAITNWRPNNCPASICLCSSKATVMQIAMVPMQVFLLSVVRPVSSLNFEAWSTWKVAMVEATSRHLLLPGRCHYLRAVRRNSALTTIEVPRANAQRQNDASLKITNSSKYFITPRITSLSHSDLNRVSIFPCDVVHFI